MLQKQFEDALMPLLNRGLLGIGSLAAFTYLESREAVKDSAHDHSAEG